MTSAKPKHFVCQESIEWAVLEIISSTVGGQCTWVCIDKRLTREGPECQLGTDIC